MKINIALAPIPREPFALPNIEILKTVCHNTLLSKNDVIFLLLKSFHHFSTPGISFSIAP